MKIGTLVKLDSSLAEYDNYLYHNIDRQHTYQVEDFAYTKRNNDLLIAIRDNKQVLRWVDSDYFVEAQENKMLKEKELLSLTDDFINIIIRELKKKGIKINKTI